MIRHAATFTLGLAAGVVLALLLTHPATSRAPSAPRPAATILATLRPVAPLRTGVPNGPGIPDRRPMHPAVAASPTPRPEAEPAPLESDLRAGGRPALSTPGASPSPTRRPRAATRPADGLRGVASWMPESYGARYLALPQGPGHRVRICGAGDCMVMTSNDAGPSKRMQREGRIADIGVLSWERICGVSRSRGLCRVTVEAVQ